MQRDLSEPIERPAASDDVELVAYTPDRSADVLAARNDAFRDHWGSLPSTPERWGQFVDGPFLRPDLSTLAMVDGRVVAFCLASVNEEDWDALGAPNTYIDLIGVVRDHRGRRLAPAVIARTLEAAKAPGSSRPCSMSTPRARPEPTALRAARVPRDAAPASAGPPLLGERVGLRTLRWRRALQRPADAECRYHNGPRRALSARERATLSWANPRCSGERPGEGFAADVSRSPRSVKRIRERMDGRTEHTGGGLQRAPPPAAERREWVGTPRTRRRAGLSIYWILLIMLLSVSVLSSIVVGIIGYVNGTEALRAIAYEKLVEIRESRAREVTQLFATIQNAVRLGAMNETSKQAAVAFAEGFAELNPQPVDPAASTALADYYRQTFAADLAEATGEDVDGATFAPRTPAAQYLQDNYVIPYETGRRRSSPTTRATAAPGRRRTRSTTTTSAR